MGHLLMGLFTERPSFGHLLRKGGGTTRGGTLASTTCPLLSKSWGKEGQGRERCKQGMVAFMVVLRALHLFASWHIHQLLRRDGWSCELVPSFLQAMVWI